MRFLLYWAVFGLCLLSVPAFAQEATTKRILLVGNSYTYSNDMPGVLQKMLNSSKNKGVTYIVDNITEGGAKIKTHLEHGSVMHHLQENHYDVVVLQEQSTTIFYSNERVESEAAFANLTAQIESQGAKAMVLSTWPRKAGDPFYTSQQFINFAPPKGPDAMAIALEDYYRGVSQGLGITLVPVLTVWQKIVKNNPTIDLYSSDGTHPSVTGSYLTAVMIFAAVTGAVPDDTIWAPGEIDYKDRRAVIRTARDVMVGG